MTTPTDGVELNWVQARDVLACVEQLVERHARLMADAPALSGAADRCAEDAVGAIEDLAEPLARWADALDDWQAAAQRQIDDRQALAEALIARLAAADAQTPAAVRAAVHAVMGLRAPEDSESADGADANADADAEAATSEPPAAPLALADTADVSDASGDLALAGSPDAAEPAAPAAPGAPAEPAEPESVEQIPPSAAARRAPAVDVAVAAPAPLPPLPPRRPAPEPSDSAEMSAAFDFPLHDLDPLAEADEEPSPFDFDDGPANDDLSTLQSKDLDDVIDATPALEVEDITMGSLGLMETSALSTDQVRAQLKVIRAERAAAAVAARTDPPAPAAPVEASVEIAIEVDAPAPGPDAADQRAESPAPEAPSAPSTSFPPLPRRSTDSLIEASVVEVESGPIDVLDVRQLLGEPPSRPSRIDAAVRAALSSPPEAARAPRSRPPTTDQSDWLEATPTSYPPASALQGAPATQSIEGDPDSVERAPIDGEMDKTVALQSVDLSAAMEAVDAEDWLDASQSAELLTSNQSLEALARDAEPEADDPWAALDISTHGELKAGHVTQPRPTRAALNVSIGVEYCGRFFTARSVNISSAGMLVTCEQDIDDGERVDLFFEMPRGESIAVQATVCRSKAAAERRVALAFVNLRYDDRVVIDRYVTSKTA